MADPSKNFGDAAERYRTFRPDYPPEVFDFLVEHVGADRRRAVDLGAGSGQATRKLAQYFNSVTAIEPDARQARAAAWPENVNVEVLTSEEAAFSEGSIDAVISATAFHWMDQEAICKNAALWLRSGGVFFPFAFDAFGVDGTAASFYNGEFEKWAAFRDRRIVECYDYEAAITNSGVFVNVTGFAQTSRYELTAETATGLMSTFSFARAYAHTQENADAYFQSLKDNFENLGPTVCVTASIKGALGVKA